MEKLGEPKGEFTGNPVPVGLWTKTEEDGPASCTYDMDLFFDHIQEKAVGAITAGEAKDGLRHWYHEWDANYGGNHSFEIHRFRTCDGKRELIGVSELEVVLM